MAFLAEEKRLIFGSPKLLNKGNFDSFLKCLLKAPKPLRIFFSYKHFRLLDLKTLKTSHSLTVLRG